MPTSPTRIVFLAAQKDWTLLDQFCKHLAPLEQVGQVSIWQENKIPIGEDRKKMTQTAIQSADFIIPLISADFLAADPNDGWGMSLIQEQQPKTNAILIPLILRECMWTYSIFGKMEVLPKNGQAMISQNRATTDHAFATIATEIAQRIATKKKTSPDAHPNLKVEIIDSIYTDPRDGQTYPTTEFLGKTWMTKNLNFALEEGYQCYANHQENGSIYGGLYTWSAAQKACPPGWHLSTDEEWKALLEYFGNTHLAYKHLLAGGDSPLLFLRAGKWSTYQKACIDLTKTGFYWSNQEVNYAEAIYYMFDDGMTALLRHSVDKNTAASCRCVLN